MAKKKDFTSREKVLHRALAEAAWGILNANELRLLTSEKAETVADVEAVVANMSQRNLRDMATLLDKSCQRKVAAMRRGMEEHNRQERLALQLVWLCLGGGRSKMPPDPLPSKLDVGLHSDIYRSTAELVGNIAARAFPVGQSMEAVKKWKEDFQRNKPLDDWFRAQAEKLDHHKVALAAHEKIRKLEEEAEKRETALNQSQMANATLRRLQDENQKLRDEKAALADVIADLKLDLKARE